MEDVQKIRLELVSPTKYDWREAAQQITRGCTTPYDRCLAIYRWLCDNMAYDTSFRIRRADEAWKRHKGVCQAYCELFYRLGMAAGVDVRIVSGQSKSLDGGVSEEMHAWIIANRTNVIKPEECFPESITYFASQPEKAKFAVSKGLTPQDSILIDPTWGAGSVHNGKFIKAIHCMTWFDVAPEWMVFTHFPENTQDQLLGRRSVDWDAFKRLPYMHKDFEGYGFNPTSTLKTFLNNPKIQFPSINPAMAEYLEFENIPVAATLQSGNTYRFIFKKKKICTLALFNGNGDREDSYNSKWKIGKQNSISIEHTVEPTDELSIGMLKDGGSSFLIFLTYRVI